MRGNAIMTHVHKDRPEAFTVGGVFDNDLVRTPEGWRVSKTAMRVIWTSGEPPSGVLAHGGDLGAQGA